MSDLAVIPSGATDIEQVKDVKRLANIVRALYNGVLEEGKDYGTIPGTGDKPTLLQPGMEKLMRALRVAPHYREVCVIRDYDKPLFHYEYECELEDVDTKSVIPGGRGIGLCHSRETKYGYRWVQRHQVPKNLNPDELATRGGVISEFAFAIEKAETSGKYGKPAEYWKQFQDAIADGTARKVMRTTARGQSEAWEIDGSQYRIPNPDVFDQVNTIAKMAQKRALASAIKGAANVSEFFTVDMEDFALYEVQQPTITVQTTNIRSIDMSTGEVIEGKVIPPAPTPEPPPTTPHIVPKQESNPLDDFGLESANAGKPVPDTLKPVLRTEAEKQGYQHVMKTPALKSALGVKNAADFDNVVANLKLEDKAVDTFDNLLGELYAKAGMKYVKDAA